VDTYGHVAKTEHRKAVVKKMVEARLVNAGKVCKCAQDRPQDTHQKSNRASESESLATSTTATADDMALGVVSLRRTADPTTKPNLTTGDACCCYCFGPNQAVTMETGSSGNTKKAGTLGGGAPTSKRSSGKRRSSDGKDAASAPKRRAGTLHAFFAKAKPPAEVSQNVTVF
jgi:hypothetical protein